MATETFFGLSSCVYSCCLYSWCSVFWGLDPGKIAPRRASELLKITKDFSGIVTLMYKPNNLEPTSTAIPFIHSHKQANIFPSLNNLRARYQTTRDHPYSPGPAKIYWNCLIFKSYSAYLPCLTHFSLWKPQWRLSAMTSPLFPLPSDQSWSFPTWTWVACCASCF